MKFFILKLLRLFHLINKSYYKRQIQMVVIRNSKFFDGKWYLKKYPSVAKKKINPAEHYLEFGWKEGKNPGPYFDGNNYLKLNQDVAASGFCPLFHYENWGKYENRCLYLKNNIFKSYGFIYKFLRVISRKLNQKLIQKNKNAKILVHLHLYYTNAWIEIKEYLENLSCYNYDLIVTYRDTLEDTSILNEIKKYKRNTKIIPCDNRGFDIGPFIDLLNRIDLKKYDIVYHLHSKSVAGEKGRITYDRLFKGKSWFLQLFSGTLGVFNVHKGINCLMNDNLCGMIGANNLIFTDTIERQLLVKKYADFLKIKVPNSYSFIGGTCFGIKTGMLKPIKNLGLNIKSFQPSKRYIFTLAHAMERIISIVVLNNGLNIKGFKTLHNNHMLYVANISKFKKKRQNKIIKKIEKVGFTQVSPLFMDIKSGLNIKFYKGLYKSKPVFIKYGGEKSITLNEYNMQKKYAKILGNYCPKIIDFDIKLPLIAMEKIDGFNLEELINFGIAKKYKKDIIKQLQEIKKKLKNSNLLHRDIRPANIMFSDKGIVKLIDFQFAVTKDKKGRFNELDYVIQHPQLLKSLGEDYCPANHFDDGYSLDKIIKEVRKN